MKKKLSAMSMLLIPLIMTSMLPKIETMATPSPLVGFWRFDEGSGSTAYDSSGYNNDGALLPADGPTWTTSGKYNGALIFDGVNDYVRVPDSNSLDVVSNITLEAWIYPHTVAKDYQVIVCKHNHTDNNRSYYLGLQMDKIAFYLSQDGVTNRILISATSIAANVWTHVAATSDGTTMKLFINGVQDPNTIAAPSTIHAHSYPLIIGAYLPSVTGYQRHFDGVIDEVAVFNEVVSPVHNVAVTGITSLKPTVGKGMNCSISVVVQNLGEYPETFNVSLYFNSNSIENQTASNLGSKNSTTITFTWNTTAIGKGNYTISAYAWPVPAEISTADNNCTDGWILITKVGDHGGPVNYVPTFFACDGKVDGYDLCLFIACYRTFNGIPMPPPPPPPEAIYLADLGGPVDSVPTFFKCDGRVDYVDLALFAQCYKGLGPS